MGEDRKFPIAFIGEEFDYKLRNGRIYNGEVDIDEYPRNFIDVIHATVLKVSTNHFTGEYVYKIRNDHLWGSVDEGWYTECKVQSMKGVAR